MSPLAHQNVLVLGLGTSGLAMARWCVGRGARVTVVDTRSTPPQLAALQLELPDTTFVQSDLDEALLELSSFDLILKSPGLSPSSVAGLMNAAVAAGITRAGELDLFMQALAELKEAEAYTPELIGVTGTNGKTTVTSLTGQLVQSAGKSVAVAGNIGPSLLDTLSEKIGARLSGNALPDVWVLELSSFQLDGCTTFEPSVATVLNVTQDHLDWHGTLPAYAAAKLRVFGNGLMLLNRDDPRVMAALPPLVKGRQVRQYITFGVGEPTRPGDYGIETVNGMSWLVRAIKADETVKKRRSHASLPPEGAVTASGRPGGGQRQDEETVLHIQRFMPLDALRIRGRHNATNALAALALATAVGCQLAPMLHGLREYRGEPHRVEPVAVVNDVEYFDDSKGTNVGATVAALEGLGVDRKLVLIAGGDGKGQDFSPLVGPVARYARAVVLIGRDAALLKLALHASGVATFDATTLQAAVEIATQQTHAGDAVLMSPACASFDMFDNYEHRARVFCDAVRVIALDQGVTP